MANISLFMNKKDRSVDICLELVWTQRTRSKRLKWNGKRP